MCEVVCATRRKSGDKSSKQISALVLKNAVVAGGLPGSRRAPREKRLLNGYGNAFYGRNDETHQLFRRVAKKFIREVLSGAWLQRRCVKMGVAVGKDAYHRLTLSSTNRLLSSFLASATITGNSSTSDLSSG